MEVQERRGQQTAILQDADDTVFLPEEGASVRSPGDADRYIGKPLGVPAISPKVATVSITNPGSEKVWAETPLPEAAIRHATTTATIRVALDIPPYLRRRKCEGVFRG